MYLCFLVFINSAAQDSVTGFWNASYIPVYDFRQKTEPYNNFNRIFLNENFNKNPAMILPQFGKKASLL